MITIYNSSSKLYSPKLVFKYNSLFNPVTGFKVY
jgi:hypothetical protein